MTLVAAAAPHPSPFDRPQTRPRRALVLGLATLVLPWGCGQPKRRADDGAAGWSAGLATSAGLTTAGSEGATGSGSGTSTTGVATTSAASGEAGTAGASGSDLPAPLPDLPAPTPECNPETWSIPLPRARPRALLLLDLSGSMMGRWDHDRDPATPSERRWATLHVALTELLARQGERLDWGALRFPARGATLDAPVYARACRVDPTEAIAPAAGQRDAILASLPAANATDLAGGTPTRDAVLAALSLLSPSLDATDERPPPALVLVTDGAANCAAQTAGEARLDRYDDGLVPVVAQAAAGGIATYVIGVGVEDRMATRPTTNPWVALNAVAEAGGVPRPGPERFYAVHDAAALDGALATIAGDITCTVALPRPLAAGEQLTVEVDGVAYDPVSDCAVEDGFVLASAPGSTALVLCGEACPREDPAIVALAADVTCVGS